MRGGIRRPQIAPGQIAPSDLLKMLDTLHDFWFTERHGNAGQAVIIRGIIDRVYHEILGFNVARDLNLVNGEHTEVTRGFEDLTRIGGTARVAGKLSDFENKVREFLAEKYPMEVRAGGKMSLTYDEVLADMNTGNPILTALRAKKDSQGTIDLNNGARPIKSLSSAQRSQIAEFILRYLFASDSREAENPIINSPRGITYDMSPGRVDDVFTNIDQVYNALYPTNFADSAGTSLQSARNRYVWPSSPLTPPSRPPFAWAPAPAPGMRPDYVAESNIYTEGEVEFRIVDKGYSHKNPYGFIVRVLIAAVPGCWENKTLDFPFSPAQTTGPSVTYLCNIMEEMNRALTPGAVVQAVSTGGTSSKVLSLQPLVNWVYSLPVGQCRNAAAFLVQRITLDWKREGDYGQMRAPAAGDLNCSGDILAAEASKINQKRGTFWQHSDHIIVTRYPPAGGVDDGLGQARKFRYWAEGSIEKLQTISEAAGTGFGYMLGQFNLIAANGILSDRLDPAYKSNLLTTIAATKTGGHITVEAYLAGATNFRSQYSEVLSSALIRILASQRAKRASVVNTEIATQVGRLESVQGYVPFIQQAANTEPPAMEALNTQYMAQAAQAVAGAPANLFQLREGFDTLLAGLPTFLNLTFSRGPPPAPGTLGPIKRDSLLLKSTANAEQAYVASKATNLMFDFSAADVAPVTAAYWKLASILFFGRYDPASEKPAQAAVRYAAFADLREKLDTFISYAGNDVGAPGILPPPAITLPQRASRTEPLPPSPAPASVDPTWKDWTEWFMSCYYLQDLTGAEMRTFVVNLPEVMMYFTNLTPPTGAPAAPPAAPPAGGGERVQTGGADDSQYIDLGKLLRAVCARSARDVNGVLSLAVEAGVQTAGIPCEQIIGQAGPVYLGAMQSTLEDVAIDWTAGVDNITNESLGDYGVAYMPTPTTDLITCILLMRSSQSGLGFELLSGGQFPSLTTDPRTAPVVSFIIGILTAVDGVQRDVRILIALTLLDKWFSGNYWETTYFGNFPPRDPSFPRAPASFSAADWGYLPTVVQTAIQGAPVIQINTLPPPAPVVAAPIPLASLGVLGTRGQRRGGRKTHRRRLPKLI
jgi:hypothetical protein